MENNETDRIDLCSAHEIDEECMKQLVRKPEGKTLLGRPKCRRENSIKIALRDRPICCDCADWIHVLGPVTASCEHSNTLSVIYVKGRERLDQLSDYNLLKRSMLHGIRLFI
jgi:hypothetical protein